VKAEKTARWNTAQIYEREWWRSHVKEIGLDFYRDYAEDLVEDLGENMRIGESTKILEIGSGAAGILTHLPGRLRCAVDPMETFFSSVAKFVESRDTRVRYHAGKAEALPFKEGSFDLVIMDNVLDHCQETDAALSEMRRVLKKRSLVYLRLNTHTRWGKGIRFFLELFRIDRGHPHTFSKGDLFARFRKYGFGVRRVKSRGFTGTWMSEMRSKNPREILKAALFLTPDKTLFILEKV
jgi:ubiquinone/menaquinone biosynthesis C-methylase UbiE